MYKQNIDFILETCSCIYDIFYADNDLNFIISFCKPIDMSALGWPKRAEY